MQWWNITGRADGGYAPPNPALLAAGAFGGNLMVPCLRQGQRKIR